MVLDVICDHVKETGAVKSFMHNTHLKRTSLYKHIQHIPLNKRQDKLVCPANAPSGWLC